MMDLGKLCESVIGIARETGKWMASERLKFDDSLVEFKGLHDLVSYVDKKSEKKIVEFLSALLPESGFIAEEGTSSKIGEVFNWIIDPLDGTTNYIQGVPVYSVSIGLRQNEELVLGVVYEVGRDECFYAWKDGGAWMNGQPIKISQREDIHHTLLATGFPYTNFEKLDQYLEFLKWTMRNSRGVRRLGSAAVDLAYVACGRFDAFWEYNLNAWDVAAGAFIVMEAGGKVTDFKGQDNYIFGREILASNHLIYDTILGKLQEYMID